jgi:hypothetical protein
MNRYPQRMAWQLDCSREGLKETRTLDALYEFIKHANDFGSITRQVARSHRASASSPLSAQVPLYCESIALHSLELFAHLTDGLLALARCQRVQAM